jgi:NSS family neurotransmitter:Na+ symporter
MTSRIPEAWSGRLGAILAVAGSAVGLGNFIRFPAQAAQYGGGAFMIAYFVSFLLIGIPLCWSEWTLGRMGGRSGFHSTAAVLHAVLRRPWAKYVGALGFVVVTLIYCYYVVIEAWCLGYAANAVAGTFHSGPMDFGAFFAHHSGQAENGASMHFGLRDVGLFLILTFALNLFFVYRGLSRGIEWVCRYGLPALILIGLIILVRVLTLGTPDPAKPEQNVLNGLGFLWNPGAVGTDLLNPQLWLAAASQVFFSLSIGMGVIITYASYLKPKDDVVLSGLTAAAANEVCEVGIGGLMTIPAAYVFLGATGIVGGTMGMGFVVLPEVFALMAGGQLFAVLYFSLLFLAAITSSLSMLQPGIALLEEGLGLGRRASVTILGLLTAAGTVCVWYFSKDLKALDTIDFWTTNVLLFIQASMIVVIFGWVIGVERGLAEARRGAQMSIPAFWGPIIRYVCPLFLGTIFLLFLVNKVIGWNFQFGDKFAIERSDYVTDLIGPDPNPVAIASVALILLLTAATCVLVRVSARRWDARLDSLASSSTPSRK